MGPTFRRWAVGASQVVVWTIGVGLLLRQPHLTDGLRWEALADCKYLLTGKLPFREERPFLLGDTLVRIDYAPACQVGIPPRRAETTLFLYEVQRKGEKHLLFAEFRLYPVLGWFQNALSLGVGISLGLIVWAGGLLVGWVMISLRRYVALSGYMLMGLGWLLLACGLWLWWAYAAYAEEEGWAWLTVGMLGIGWSFWRWWAGVLAALIAALSTWLWPAQANLLAGAVLGSMGFWLKGPWKIAYGLLWLLWVYTYDSVWLPLLFGTIASSRLIPFLQNAYKILTRRERYFYLLALLLAAAWVVGVGKPFQEVNGWWLIGGGVGGGLVAISGIRALYGLYQRRRRAQRRSLLERELPLLWDVPDVGTLERRVRALLNQYWDVEGAALTQAPGPQGLWLRRQSKPPPVPDWLHFEAAIPLGEPYWLLIGAVRSPLTIEDLLWLERFGRYVGISWRHLSLYEAAHEARLQALRHQLSPHFLFNALHILQGLLYEDVTLAEKLLSRLGQLLRRSLDLAKHLLIPLSEELALVQDYLEIEKQRYGTRLILHWEVPEPLPEAFIPPFTIQTLVENAIKHAVAKQMRPTTIHLRVFQVSDRLEIIVADDGPGFPAGNSPHGIGLSNLRTRLEHIYGLQAQMIIQSGGRGGVQVVVTLPLAPLSLKTIPPGHSQSPGAAPS
jgi:signal transduction histidine kinase